MSQTPPDGGFVAAPGTATGSSLAFATAHDRDGVTVITAAATREHAARVTPAGGAPTGSRRDAWIAGRRPAGAFVVVDGRVRWRPALDVTRLLVTAEVVVGAVVVAQRLAARPSAAKAVVTMGPGGWVSMKGGAMAVRPARRGWSALPRPRSGRAPSTSLPKRPLWARLLAATTLQAVLRA